MRRRARRSTQPLDVMLHTDQDSQRPPARRSMAWAVLWLVAVGAVALSFVADSLGFSNVSVLLRILAALFIVGFLMLVIANYTRARSAVDRSEVLDERSGDR
jgi:hypothetical protein